MTVSKSISLLISSPKKTKIEFLYHKKSLLHLTNIAKVISTISSIQIKILILVQELAPSCANLTYTERWTTIIIAQVGLLIELISLAVQAAQTLGKKIIGPDKQIIDSKFSACQLAKNFSVSLTTTLDNFISRATTLFKNIVVAPTKYGKKQSKT